MAKQRYINTKFWSDSFVIELNPLDRYLFFYLLTNEHTNIAGIYELPFVRMAQETGIDKEMLPKMLERLATKIKHVDGWVIIKNFQRHQKQNDSVKIGISKVMVDLPMKIRGIYTGWVQPDTSLYPDTELSEPEPVSVAEPEPKPESASAKDVVNYFFELKGWANKNKDFYLKNKIIYARFMKPAKELLTLCEGSLEEAKECLKKVSVWAISRELDWSIETVFKKWYDLDLLKPKEKKPYYQGKRIFQKVPNGKWWCVSQDGNIRELGLYPKTSEIIYK